MSLVNSGIGTKACVWDFHADGGLGFGNVVYSGIAFKPGDVILDIRFQVLDAVVGAAATEFQFLWGNVVLLSVTQASLSTAIFAFWGRKDAGVTQTTDFSDSGATGYKPHIVFGSGVSLNGNFTSTAPFTAGKIAVLVTYAFTRF